MSSRFTDQIKTIMESIYRIEYKMRFKHLYEDIICANLPGDIEINQKRYAFERISKYLKREASCKYLKLPSHANLKWRCRRDDHTIVGIDPRPHCWNCIRRIPLDPITYGKITRGHRSVILREGLPGYRKYMLRRAICQKSLGEHCSKIWVLRPRWYILRDLENLLSDQTTESNVDLRSTSAFPIVDPSLTRPVLEGGVHAV